MSEGEPGSEQPQKHAAGVSPLSGVAPPVETRWRPGQSGNPGGRPHGSSPRAVLLRRMAENPNQHGEGELAVQIAESALGLLVAIRSADCASDFNREDVPDITADTLLKRLDAHLKVIHEVDGKPQERVEHSGSTSISATFTDPRAPEVPPS